MHHHQLAHQLKFIFFSFLLSSSLTAVPSSQLEALNLFTNPTTNPNERYLALKVIDSRVSQCKEYYYDPEFWLRLGCLENYVTYGKQNGIDLNFLTHFLTDEALVIRSFALKVFIKLQPKTLENTLWFVIEDPRNYKNGEPFSNVLLALQNVTRSVSTKKKAENLQNQFPGLRKLASFKYLL